MSEQDKAIAHRVFEEVWNKRNLNVIPEVTAANFIGNQTGG